MGKLSIVGTPIGNLEDITLRALRTLKEASVVYAEDTRVTSKLLARYEIRVPMQRLDAATEMKKISEVAARIEAGENVVYVSDAGTPAISDPGSRLVAGVRSLIPDAQIEAIPGASAVATALSVAGATSDAFTFLGFLPHKKGRKTMLDALAKLDGTIVLYESPHRIAKLFAELASRVPERHAVIARELTKMHEQVVAGTVAELSSRIGKDQPDDGLAGIPARGEFVVVLNPSA